MRSEQLDRWVGVGLTLVGVVAMIWLTLTGRLTLYIHPRYTAFTVVMALLAGAAVVAAIVARSVDEGPEDEHHDGPGAAPDPARPALARAFTWARVAVLVAAALALLVVPPATLTARTRQSRELAASGQALTSTDTTVLAGADPTTFSVKDWAALLREGGSSAVVGKRVHVSGYVLDQGGGDDVYYVVRLLVSCCAVDAQPVGLPVYSPGWHSQLHGGDWVLLDGTFADNPDPDSHQSAVVKVASLTKIAEPKQPYIF